MTPDIQEYFSVFQNTVRAAAASDGSFTEQSFVDEVSRRLTIADEVDSLVPSHYEGVGSRQRRIRMDGYDFGDEDGQAVFAVADYTQGDVLETLTTTDARRLFGQLQAFVTSALDGSLQQSIEESTEAHQVAADLHHRRSTLFKIRLYLLTNRRLSDSIRSFATETIDGIELEFHLWDVQRFERVEFSRLGREQIDIDLTEWKPEGVPVIRSTSETTGIETYLAVLPGELLAGIYRRHGARLLEANVRSFLTARGNVNRGMRGTIQQQPGMFLAYNNGITATASEVTLSSTNEASTMISVKDLQIVNGGQTTASLFYVEKNDRADLSEIRVQMKLIVVDDKDAADLVPKISRWANTQNRVSEADFFSNHPFHVRMEELSRRILAPTIAGSAYQTKWFYERTRGQYLNEKARLSTMQARRFDAENPARQVITKTDAAKYLVSWGERPHVVSAGAQKNFIAFANQISDEWTKEEAQFGEAYYKKLVSLDILYNAVRGAVQRSDWYSSGYLANVVTYSLAKLATVVRSINGGGLDFSVIWRSQSVPQPLLEVLSEIAHLAFRVLTDENRPVDNVTEWAKREKCWEHMMSIPFDVPEELRPLILSASEVRESNTDNRRAQRLDSGIGAQIQVMNLGSPYWVKLREFGREMKLLTPKDQGILAYATGEAGRLPSDAQSSYLLQLSERMKTTGFVGN